MSFRRAQDHTYIAQLLGRMVRTPLARRVEVDAALNDVHLFLPHYDQATVESVIQDLKNVEDVPPSETGTSRELVTLYRRENMEEIFEVLCGLVTYRVNAVRKQSALRRLMGLGARSYHNRIDEDAQEAVKKKIVENMAGAVQRLRNAGSFEERAKQITGIDLKNHCRGAMGPVSQRKTRRTQLRRLQQTLTITSHRWAACLAMVCIWITGEPRVTGLPMR